MHDPRTVAALIETVRNQSSDREAGCLSMLGERVLVAEIERLRTVAAKALHEMCNTVAPRDSFTDAVDELDDTLRHAE